MIQWLWNVLAPLLDAAGVPWPLVCQIVAGIAACFAIALAAFANKDNGK